MRPTKSASQVLIDQALRHEEPIPVGVQERVWRGVRHAQGRTAAQHTWPMFFAGAAMAGMLGLFLVTRDHHQALRAGVELPSAAQPTLFELADNADIVVGTRGRATLTRYDQRDLELRIDHGTVLVHALPRGSRGPFIVRTPRFVARVVGTVFRVSVDDDGTSRIAVAHGAVDVQPTDQAARIVRAHETWPPQTEGAPSADELALLPQTEPVTRADFGASALHVCAGDAEARLRCELALAQDSSPREAENALYQAALIAWRELKDARRALALWRLQRERFPNGALRHEVQASMIDALVASRSLRDAEREIESYLAAEPDDLRAPELHFVLGTIEHELDGNCQRAKAELDVALAHPAEPWAARARAALHGCVTF